MEKNSLLARRAAKKKNLAAELFSGLGRRNLNQNDSMNKSTVITDNQSIQKNRPPPLSLKKSESQRRKESKKTKDTFEAKYDLYEELGQGAHAVVKRCIKKSNKKQYAVKIIRSSDEEIVIASVNCFKLQKPLNACNLLCKNYELFIDEEKENIYQVMDYIEWPSIAKFQHQFPQKQIPEDIVKIIVKQICQAVEYMHDKGICHRDLKPDNILVDTKNNYKIKIIDFGIARKFLSKDPCNKYNILRHDMWSRTGTLCYKSPEMFSSANYNESCDIWSVGVITYEILSGKLPFYEEYQTDTIEKIEECDYKFYDVGNFQWKQHTQARDFIKRILKPLDKKRLTAKLSLNHPFLSSDEKKAKNIKDDGGINNSTYKVGFEMAKSTAADQLQIMRKQHRKISNNQLKKTDSRGNQQEQKQNKLNSNNSELSDKSNPSYLKQNHSQESNPMTVSQIQMLKEDDIHFVKQKNNFTLLFNSKKEDIYQSVNTNQHQSPDQLSINNSQKQDIDDLCNELKLQNSLSIKQEPQEEKHHKQSFNIVETRGQSVSICFNKPSQDIQSNSSSNASPQLKPPGNNSQGYQKDPIYNSMNPCGDQDQIQEINLNENNQNLQAHIINKYNSNENLVYSEQGDESKNNSCNQLPTISLQSSKDQNQQNSNNIDVNGSDSDDEQYRQNFQNILNNELQEKQNNTLQIVNQQKIRDSYQNNVPVIAEEDIQDEQTEFTASPHGNNTEKNYFETNSQQQQSQSQIDSSNLSSSPVKTLQMSKNKQTHSQTSLEVSKISTDMQSSDQPFYKKHNSANFQMNQLQLNTSKSDANQIESEFSDLQDMPEIKNNI